MEKQSNSGRRPPAAQKKLPKERVFNAVHLSEDEASKLVGGIVEKGVFGNFTTPPSSTPQPSILPFPVARHRSHGPHWTPNVSQCGVVGSEVSDDDDDDDEDNDPTNYDPIAVFAEPIKKKKKKGLDFRRWKEFVPSNDVSKINEKVKNNTMKKGVEIQKMNGDAMRITDKKSMDKKPSMAIDGNNYSASDLHRAINNFDVAVDTSTDVDETVAIKLDRLVESSSTRSNYSAVGSGRDQSISIKGHSAVPVGGAKHNDVTDEAHLDRSSCDDVDMGMEPFSSVDMLGLREGNPSVSSVPSSTGYKQGDNSLESQIDAENRALLNRMSPEEIAEAQAEIRNRINPELLKILKKRGLQRLEKQTICDSGTANGLDLGDKQTDKHVAEGEKKSSVQESTTSPPTIIPGIQNTKTSPDEGDVENSLSKGSSLWDTWSKRVEAVRNQRFSLDGDVIEGSSWVPSNPSDNVAERDFLRMEGDPGAAGYTMKEALALARSVVPGQRALALHLLASVLSKALENIFKSQLDCVTSVGTQKNLVDWEAIWAYALGPEPELILSLRLALDDNHYSVVLASAKVIQCVLACDVNENFFNRLEKMGMKDLYTAPILRSRPDITHGFLGGGFWKYSTKPSNILPPDEEIMNDNNEGEHTIQDDNVLAGQDVAAGLVRMGILPRLRYLLETEPAVALEECILSTLVAIARHSPTCANAIWKCERLVQTIIDRFTMKATLELQASKIKSVTLLRVLAQSRKSICTEFIKKGFFQVMTWQLYRVTPSIDEWLKPGRENCRLTSDLMVEQLRFWKVCIMYGHCISSFTGFFPALCLFLNPPAFDKLREKNVFHEFASICMEAYFVLETLARRLPDLYSSENRNPQFPDSCADNIETWCWADVGPMVDTALKWLELQADSTWSIFFHQQNEVNSMSLNHNNCISSLLWILSAIMHMLRTIFVKATPVDALELKGRTNGGVWPDFVAKLALRIINSPVLNFSGQNRDESSTEQSAMESFVEKLCHFRHQSDPEVSIASSCCLHELFQVIVSADRLIQITGANVGHRCSNRHELAGDGKILHHGILKGSLAQWGKVLSELMKLVTSEWHFVHRTEVFGRGGPAPGVGVGWGAFGGGFWSLTTALVQADARLLIVLLETFYSSPSMDLPEIEEKNFMMQSINSALASCLVMGPGDKVIIQNVFDILLQIPVLKYLDQCTILFLRSYQGRELFQWEYTESDFMQFGKILGSHFRNRWLSVKKKRKPEPKDGSTSCCKTVKKGDNSLDSIPEDMETSVVNREDRNSLTVEWARQRLPLPSHWLLSPIATISHIWYSNTPNGLAGVPPVQDPVEFLEVAKAGLFFLLGIEAMSSKLSDEDNSPVRSIPLTWKLHSLSVPLLVGMGVLEEERSRDIYEALQSLYGQHLDELRVTSTNKAESSMVTDLFRVNCLRFQSEIHENYSTFIETLVEQFAAISYGDVTYGRQIAMYLHRQVDASVRLATWNALSNARVLELLPPLYNCLSQAEGYLEPIEEDDGILEAYVKSWISGSLDRAATWGSVTYGIAVHHLSSFIFNNSNGERLLLRNKLVKSLLRDYSRKHQHEAMMVDLIQYNHSSTVHKPEQNTSVSLQVDYTVQRLDLLKEACEGNSQLLKEVEKLKTSISKSMK